MIRSIVASAKVIIAFFNICILSLGNYECEKYYEKKKNVFFVKELS